MIYLDSAATTLEKPGTVPRACAWAMTHLASPGRGGHAPGMGAAKLMYQMREQAARLAKALESGGEPELFEEAVLLEKMSREDLQDLLEQTVVELGRLARTSPQKARVLKAAALTARLREAAELNVGGGAAAGWLCGEMFLK